MTNDHINGLFEFGGGLLLYLNVLRLMRDKQVKGVSVLPTLFYTAWGVWNAFLYPALGMTWSYYGGWVVISANTVWLLVWAALKPLTRAQWIAVAVCTGATALALLTYLFPDTMCPFFMAIVFLIFCLSFCS